MAGHSRALFACLTCAMILPTRMKLMLSRTRFKYRLGMHKDRVAALERAANTCRWKCIARYECDAWLASHPEGEGVQPPDFCPNIRFLLRGGPQR